MVWAKFAKTVIPLLFIKVFTCDIIISNEKLFFSPLYSINMNSIRFIFPEI